MIENFEVEMIHNFLLNIIEIDVKLNGENIYCT